MPEWAVADRSMAVIGSASLTGGTAMVVWKSRREDRIRRRCDAATASVEKAAERAHRGVLQDQVRESWRMDALRASRGGPRTSSAERIATDKQLVAIDHSDDSRPGPRGDAINARLLKDGR